MNLEVGFVSVPAPTRAASDAVSSLAQRLAHHRQQLYLPPPDKLMADGEPAQQHDLAEIPQCQPVAQPAEHHEGDNVARQRRSIEDAATTLVELWVAVPAPTEIALRGQVWPLSDRPLNCVPRNPSQSAPSSRPAAILGKPHHAPPAATCARRDRTIRRALCSTSWFSHGGMQKQQSASSDGC